MKKYGVIIFLLLTFAVNYSFAGTKKYIVQLKSEPIVKSIKKNFKSIKAKSFKKAITDEQNEIINFVEKQLKGKVNGKVSTVLNAIFVELDESKLNQLKKNEKIKGVYPDLTHKLFLDEVSQVHKLKRAVAKLGKDRSKLGAGIKIGILDTGVNIDNPMFDDTGFTYPDGFDAGVNNFPEYTNNKVIVAKVFSNAPTPDDKRGHGTSVASCAAGNKVTATSNGLNFDLEGSAAGAYIGNYKVFPDYDMGAQQSSIINAINTAVEDGMDILNLSLGSIPGGAASSDPEVVAIENAVEAGVIVVVAAGNDGEYNSENTTDSKLYGKVYQQSVGSPSVAPSCISVAATNNGRIWSSIGEILVDNLSVDTSLQGFPYGKDSKTASNLTEDFGPYEIVDIESLGVNEEGCDDFGSADLTGKVAFIKRGSCAFAQKMLNAQNAGAVGVLIYNNVDSDSVITMSIDESYTTLNIPGFFMRKSEGDKLKTLLDSSAETVNVFIEYGKLGKLPSSQGYKTTFSSTGPSKYDYALKPDVSAVGELIVAAAPSQEGVSYSYGIAGTSFASPITAGYMAVIKEHFPTLSPLELKGIICSTADLPLNYYQKVSGTTVSPTYTYFKKNGVAAPIATGSGKVNIEKAFRAKITPLPNNLSFGRTSISETDSGSLNKSVTIKNISNEEVTLYPKLLKIIDNEKANANLDSTSPITIQAGETASISLTISYQGEVNSQVQGYIILESNNDMSYNIPYHAWIASPLTSYTSTSDSDGDGLTKSTEYNSMTDLFVSDTDGDGYSDGDELNIYNTDPANATDYPENVVTYENKIYIPFSTTKYDDNSDSKTEVYVVNENNVETNVIVKFYTETGNLTSKPLTKEIPANGFASFSPTNDLYAAHIGYAVVEFENTVKSAATVYFLGESGEIKSSYGIPGTSSLVKKAYVPHIAEQVNQWKTYISAVNPTANDITVNLKPENADSVNYFGFGKANNSKKVDVINDLFSGNFPSSSNDRENWWGTLSTENETGFAALEYFEQNNDTSKIYQIGGLLVDDKTSKEIVIPHVETQWLWWTGMALNNPGTTDATITVTPFDTEGNQLTQSTFTLTAGKKYVNLVQGFWTDNGLEYPDATSWLKVTSDVDITGFALFGLLSNDPEADGYVDDLAAIEPIMEYKTEFIFPYVIFSGDNEPEWSGLGLINAGAEDAEVTLTGYNAIGEVVGTTNVTVNSLKKLVKLVDGSLIPNLTKDVKWIKVTSDKPIAGFELYGGVNHKYLNGIPAL